MKKKKRKPGSGGPRSGAGRKMKFGEPTEVVSFVVPKSKRNKLKAEIQAKIDVFATNGASDSNLADN